MTGDDVDKAFWEWWNEQRGEYFYSSGEALPRSFDVYAALAWKEGYKIALKEIANRK